MKLGILSIVIISFFISSTTYASPFAVSAPFDKAAVDSCQFTINNGDAFTQDPDSVSDTEARCVLDLSDVPEGNNSITMVTVNMWGVSEPAPFEFIKVLPPRPSNIQLER